jgi:hypothetical protein
MRPALASIAHKRRIKAELESRDAAGRIYSVLLSFILSSCIFPGPTSIPLHEASQNYRTPAVIQVQCADMKVDSGRYGISTDRPVPRSHPDECLPAHFLASRHDQQRNNSYSRACW